MMAAARCAHRTPRRSRSRRVGNRHRAQRVSRNGPIIACLVSALGLPTGALPLAAQERELRSYGAGAPEAKLMVFYSSSIAFSPIGVPWGATGLSAMAVPSGRAIPRTEVAIEVSYIPRLSADQRTVGTDKPEATNLAPVFPRPRLGIRLPWGLGLEGSWIPPFRVFDVKANVISAAVSRAFAVGSGVRLTPRLSVLTGRVEGPITCNRNTANQGDQSLMTYYTFVCHGNDSRDYFDPRHVSGEVIVARSFANGRWEPYLTAGARGERTRFDVGVIRDDGSRDLDNPILEVKTTRAYGTAGASWLALPRTRLSGELFYAPGSVFTVRAFAGVHLW